MIHTVGPVWRGGENNEGSTLAACYRNSLALARERRLKSIAFPLIATGTFGYPKDKALQTAIAEIGSFVLADDMTVYLVVFDEKAFALSERLVSSVQEYIDANYVAAYSFRRASNRGSMRVSSREADWLLQDMVQPRYIQHAPVATPRRGLDEAIGRLGETFSQATLRLIDERGLTDPIVCRKANIDRRLLWKIRNKADYQPGKQTVVALAFALELSLDETQDLLAKAGFTLSPSKLFDVIVRFFLEEANYDTFELNEVLFALRQKLIGVA